VARAEKYFLKTVGTILCTVLPLHENVRLRIIARIYTHVVYVVYRTQ